MEDAAAIVAHGLSQSLGKLLVGLDAAIEADPFVGVQNCPVGIRHMMGKLKGDISVGRLPFVERQGAACGLKIDEMDGILELRKGGAETADIDYWSGCVALPGTADLDALALGSAPSARGRGTVAFRNLRLGIDIAEEKDVFREEGLLFPVVPDFQNERRCELVFIKACGGLPALVEAGELAIFPFLRVGMELAFGALRGPNRCEDFRSANAGCRPTLSTLRKAFTIVIGRKNRGDLLGDIVLLQQTAAQYSLGDATGSGDDRVASLVAPTKEKRVDAVDGRHGRLVDQQKIGSDLPFRPGQANNKCLECDIVEVRKPRGTDFVSTIHDRLGFILFVVGFGFHLDQMDLVPPLHQNVGANEKISIGKGGFVDCCLRSEQQLGGLGKSVLAFQSIDQLAGEHLSGKFAYLESPLGERFQKFVVRIRVGIRLRVVRVENLGRAIEAQAITRLGEERHRANFGCWILNFGWGKTEANFEFWVGGMIQTDNVR